MTHGATPDRVHTLLTDDASGHADREVLDRWRMQVPAAPLDGCLRDRERATFPRAGDACG